MCQAVCDNGISFMLCWTEDELCAEEITDGNRLLTAIPALVKTCGNPDCPLPDMSEYSFVLYFTAEEAEAADAEKVHLMLCADGGESVPGSTVFAPDNYQDVLQRLEV